MLKAITATLTIFLILLLSEYFWRKLKIRGEFARKFVHILAGSFIAFLPLWISYGWIIILAIGFIDANLLNRYTELFHAIHAITRKSWGDLFFGVGILVLAIMKPNKWLFIGAILQVSLADGLAAVIGSHYGKRRYQVFDHIKSPVGTVTFFITSLIVLTIVILAGKFTSNYNQVQLFAVIPLLMTLLENVGGYGTDNMVLPIGFVIAMQLLRF